MKNACSVLALCVWSGAQAAELAVHDVSDCLDAEAIRTEMSRWVPHPELVLEVSVLPEGNDRAVQIQVLSPVRWERSLTIGKADCVDAPGLIAATVERGISGLPGMTVAAAPLDPNWASVLGISMGVGLVPPAPNLAGDFLVSVGLQPQLLAGLQVGGGLQEVTPGLVQTSRALGVLGVGWAHGQTRYRVEAHGGVLWGRGRGFSTELTTQHPRAAIRVGVDIAVSSRVVLTPGLRVPLTPIVWILDGTGQVPEPPVRLDLGVGANLFGRK